MTKKINKKYTKSNLPTKICEFCKREMNWRRRWKNVWDEVKFCSEKCRRESKINKKSGERE